MHWLWPALLYGWTASELYIAIATRTRAGGGKRADRGSMAVLWVTIVSAITAAEIISKSTPHDLFRGMAWVDPVAIGLIVSGLIVRWTAILSLGKAFSANVAIRDSQTVYRSGLYRFVRHPSYSGMMLIFVAIALHERNRLSAAILLVSTSAALLYRIHVEESALVNAFGEQYSDYSKTTKRLIPWIY
jgi:protein-S-isoprenylcysteine O-methyltransferase Ste14